MKEDETGGACNMNGKDKNAYKIWLENVENHLEDLGIDGKILEWILGK
jgi:hypothetical protein